MILLLTAFLGIFGGKIACSSQLGSSNCFKSFLPAKYLERGNHINPFTSLKSKVELKDFEFLCLSVMISEQKKNYDLCGFHV